MIPQLKILNLITAAESFHHVRPHILRFQDSDRDAFGKATIQRPQYFTGHALVHSAEDVYGSRLAGERSRQLTSANQVLNAFMDVSFSEDKSEGSQRRIQIDTQDNFTVTSQKRTTKQGSGTERDSAEQRRWAEGCFQWTRGVGWGEEAALQVVAQESPQE